VHLVGFIIKIYHVVRFSECQIYQIYLIWSIHHTSVSTMDFKISSHIIYS